MKLNDKVALITGGTSGIGRATAIALAEAGAKIVVTGRREAEGAETVRLVEAAGSEGLFLPGDVAREADAAAMVADTVAKFGRLDVAFNNAGIEWQGAVTEASEADYRRIFDVNVWGVIVAMKYEIPAMLKTGGGSIINTSSVAGHVGMSGTSLYVGAKHAVEGLTKSAALEFATQGIRVNAVAPAAIVTEMMHRFTGGQETDASKYLASLHPIGRVGEPREIASAVVWLASDAASFVTGQSLKVDGGFTAQ